MANTNLLDVPQNFSTTLNVGGGINNSQTTGIILTSITGLPTDGGILCFDWATTLDTSVAEFIEYGGLTGNELTGVVRGSEGIAAKSHTNQCTVVGVISRQHIKRLKDALSNVVVFSTGALDLAKVVDLTTAQTLANKRRTFRVDSQATTDTITPEISTYDIFIRTAQAHALAINNHSTSTPTDGEMMEFIILGDATPRAITYGDKYVAKSGVALPSTTVASKCTKLLFQWRASLNVWDLLVAPQEA